LFVCLFIDLSNLKKNILVGFQFKTFFFI